MAALVLALLAVVLLPRGEHPGEPPEAAAVATAAAPEPLAEPTSRAVPRFLTRSYRAPPARVHRGRGGTLSIPGLGIEAPVDAVDLDGTVMAVPDDPARVGWLASTARSADLVGSSVLAGHVSDRHDRPGALARLASIRPGQLIAWTDGRGAVHRFHAARVRLYARSTGLPASLFATGGPRVLHLVTCAERVTTTGGGFHYRSNLVVTAVR